MKTTLPPLTLPKPVSATVVDAPAVVNVAQLNVTEVARTDAFATGGTSSAPASTAPSTSVALTGAGALSGTVSFGAVALRGVRLLVDGGRASAAEGRAWWVVTAPAAGSSRAVVPDAAAHALARSHLTSGDVTQAWRALAASGDGFAQLVSSTLGMKPATVYSQVVDAHWERLTGEGVTGAAYQGAVKALCERYLAFAGTHGALPSTEDIERMDRANLEKRGLSPLLATGAMQSKLAHDLGADYAWGRAMGLPPERVAHGSNVFADVDFDATLETIKTASAAVQKYGLNKALTIDGATATLRGTKMGGALSVSPVVVARVRDLAARGDVEGAWRELGRHGDDYAQSAAKIIGQKDKPSDLLACVVDAHWLRVVGPEKKAAHFDSVAQRHLDNYVALLGSGKLPDTRAIEQSYRQAVEAEGLPPLVAIDALLSRADRELDQTWLAKLGIGDFSWGAMVGMPKERITYNSDVFADLHMDPADELAATTTATLRRHPFAFLRPSNFGYSLNAVRELFT